jgi:hypothetical protein
LQKFAEFLKKNKKEDKDKLMEILLKAPYEEKELNEKTKKDLKKSEEDIKKGRVRPLSEVMKDFGL